MDNIELTIGSDPEFVIMCGDSIENALEIFQKVFPNVGCSSTPDIDILPTLETNQYYARDEYEYLQTALCDMEIEHIKNYYDEILKNHYFEGEHQAFDAANIIMDYYEKEGYPSWNEIPKIIRIAIINRTEEELELNLNEYIGTNFCTTKLGCDGQSALGEMRPKHGNNPIEHFNEILELMEQLNDLLVPEIVCYEDELQVKAGAYQGSRDFEKFLLGGHIHLGFKADISIDSLGQYLSFFCGIPLTLITDTENLYYFEMNMESERNIRHKRKQYGEYGGYREKPYGIEFRMPSSWLVSPQITIGALSLAYIVAYEFINQKRTYGFMWSERFNEKYRVSPNNYIILYKKQNWKIIQENFEPIKLEIQQMELYPKYKDYIDYIFDMIDNNETWQAERNILPLWAELW